MQAFLSLLRRFIEWLSGRRTRPLPIPPAPLQCTNYQTQPAGYGPNPTGFSGGTITVFDSQGNLMNYGAGAPRTQIKQEGTPGTPLAHRGLECGFRTVIKPSIPAMTATIELVQYARPAGIEAIDINGVVTWQDTMTAGNGIPQSFQIAPTKTADPIRELVITPPSDETLLLEICLP